MLRFALLGLVYLQLLWPAEQRKITDAAKRDTIFSWCAADDVESAHRQGRVGALMGIEAGHALRTACACCEISTRSASAT